MSHLPTVIVTRPAPECDETARRLAGLGFESVRCPAFRLVSASRQELAAAFEVLASADVVIVVSPHAARLVAAHAPASGREPRRFVTPGPGTAGILANAGLPVSCPPEGGTSEAMLGLEPLEAVSGRRVAIVGAPGGRRLLDEELTRRGAQVTRIDAYRREPEPVPDRLLDHLARGSALVVLISSMNALRSVTESLPDEFLPAWRSSTFVVSSERLESACRDLGMTAVERAAGASDDQMLAKLDDIAAHSDGGGPDSS